MMEDTFEDALGGEDLEEEADEEVEKVLNELTAGQLLCLLVHAFIFIIEVPYMSPHPKLLVFVRPLRPVIFAFSQSYHAVILILLLKLPSLDNI